ncbi:MAG: hypothetical protein HXY40_16885 [Chloroflexi bacterium]|nr:hypothetical protein [Chloroflexota bacterium]
MWLRIWEFVVTQQLPALLIMVFVVVVSAAAIYLAFLKMRFFNYLFLLALVVITLAAGFYPAQVFAGLPRDMYQSFCFNISAEFFAALVISFLALEFTTLPFIAMFLSLLLSVLSFALIHFDGLFLAKSVFVAANLGRETLLTTQLDLSLARLCLPNFGLELVAGVVTALLLMLAQLAFSKGQDWISKGVGLLIVLVIVTLILGLTAWSLPTDAWNDSLLVSVEATMLGLVITSLFLGGFGLSTDRGLPVVTGVLLLLALVLVLLFTLPALNEGFSLNMTSEILGALVTAILFEIGYFQPQEARA